MQIEADREEEGTVMKNLSDIVQEKMLVELCEWPYVPNIKIEKANI